MADPFNCPRCHALISAWSLVVSWSSTNDISWNRRQVIFQCNNTRCRTWIIKEYFIGWSSNAIWYPSNPEDFDFSPYPLLSEVSSDFVNLYNQARNIEQLWYKEIAWPWYRKAIEFLIKDYAISLLEWEDIDKERDKITNMNLQQCINNYITEDEIKQIATRAYWLGNDQTHYYQKWENKDIDDLKWVINLTLYFLEGKLKSKKLLSEMPE